MSSWLPLVTLRSTACRYWAWLTTVPLCPASCIRPGSIIGPRGGRCTLTTRSYMVPMANHCLLRDARGTRALTGMEIMVPLYVHITATSCTATPQPLHTLQAQEDSSSNAIPAHVSTETATLTATNPTTPSISDTTGSVLAALLQGVQVPAESVCFLAQVANPWPNHTVCFESSLELPLCVSSIVSSRPAVWVAFHN